MSKLKIALKATAIIEIDGGYYRNMNMEQIVEALKDKDRSISIMVQQGGSAPERVYNTSIGVDSITYIPD